MGIHQQNGEGLFTNPERPSDAEAVLGFAHEFGGDFQVEPDESLEAAPAYFRGLMMELQSERDIVAWVRKSGDDRIGSRVRDFPDKSTLEAHILYVSHVDEQAAAGAAEITIDLQASTGASMQREVIYELKSNIGRVVRTDISQDSPLDECTPRIIPPKDPEELQEIVLAERLEAELLNSGLDPSLDEDLEELRSRSEYFRVFSDERRAAHANRVLAREFGLNEQPVGLRELSQLRAAILADR